MMLPDAILDMLKLYDGEASDMMFYITTAGWGLHGQILYQYRDADLCWRYGIIDDMGFSPESAGTRTKFDLRSCKPYFTTKELEAAMPFILDLKKRWMTDKLHDFGLNPGPAVSSQEPMFIAAVRYGSGIAVMSSKTVNRGEVRFAVTRLDPMEDVFKTHYYYDEDVGFPNELDHIPQEDAERVVTKFLDDWWEDNMSRISRLYESSRNSKSRSKNVQTHSETPSREVKADE